MTAEDETRITLKALGRCPYDKYGFTLTEAKAYANKHGYRIGKKKIFDTYTLCIIGRPQ
jgi:hypothetical protein